MPSLIATIGANIGPFTRGLEEAKGKARGAGGDIGGALGGKIMGALGGIGAGLSVAGIISDTIELGSHVLDLSERLGISTDAVQRWDYALKQNGSSIESAVGFFEKLAVSRGKALAGSDEQVRSFQKLGISLEQLKSMRVEDIAGAIARTVENSDPEQIIGPLRAVGGRSAGELVAAFRNGLAGALSEASIISDADIVKLDAAGDAWGRLKMETQSAIAPGVAFVSQVLLTAMQGLYLMIGMVVGAVSAVFDRFGRLDTSSLGGFVKSAGALAKDFLTGGVLKAASEGAIAGATSMAEKHGIAAAKPRKAGKGPLALDEEESAAEKRKADSEAKKLESLDKQIAAEERKRALKHMSAEETIRALQQELELLSQKESSETDALKKKELQLEMSRKRNEIDGELEKQQKEKDREEKQTEKDALRNKGKKGRDLEVNSLQRVGGFLGTFAAAPELALLSVQQKSEQHLAQIKKGIEKLTASEGSSSDDTEF